MLELFDCIFQNSPRPLYVEVAATNKEGHMIFVKATEYGKVLENLVMKGDHVLVVEELATKLLLGEQFTKQGKYYEDWCVDVHA